MRTAHALAGLLPVLLAACAAPRPAEAPDRRPPDFTLALSVHAPDGPVRRPGQRAARYAVTPDGWLRAAIGGDAAADAHPPLARRLTPRERDELWSMVRAADPHGVPDAMRIPGPEVFQAPSGRRVYLVELTAAGRRTAVAVPEGDPDTAPFLDLADRLAAWSWVHPDAQSR